MIIKVYLDNNATTRPHRRVSQATRRYEDELYLNASSAAGELLGAAEPLAEAHAALVDLLGASDDDHIVFTSGATESNAWVFAVTPPSGHIVTSAVEHSSILAASARARQLGFPIDIVGVDSRGVIRPDELAAVVRADTRLVSLQFANNETGVVQPLADLTRTIRQIAPQALIHSDATQAVGRIGIDLGDDLAEVDAISFSAHKFHGPKGIGGLFLRSGTDLEPLIPGEQQHGRRGGTYNVPAVAGLAVAARLALRNLPSMTGVSALRDRLEAQLMDLPIAVQINAADVQRLPNTSSVALAGVDADHIVEQLALNGICVAAGSACHAGATAPSHVLHAMGLSQDAARATLRFSLSVMNSDQDIDEAVAALRALVAISSPERAVVAHTP